MGAEVRQRGYLRDLLADTDVWSDWTGLATSAERKSRISWPDYPGTDQLPAIVLACGASQRTQRIPGGGDATGFRANGELLLLCFDAVNTENTNQEEDDRFGGLFTDLIDELVTLPALASWESPMKISRVAFPEVPWRRTNLNTEDDLDVGQDDEDLFRGAVWMGKVFIGWGVFD